MRSRTRGVVTYNYTDSWSIQEGRSNVPDDGYPKRTLENKGYDGRSHMTWKQKTFGSEYMEDNISTHREFKECFHTRQGVIFNPDPQPIYYWYKSHGKYYVGCRSGHGFSKPWYTDPRSRSFCETRIDSTKPLAMPKLLPQINDGFSLLNFCWELRDLRDLLKLCKSLRVLFTSVPRSDRPLAELYVGYNFGVKPLLSDLEKIYYLTRNSQRAIKDFIQRGLKGDSYHFRTNVEDSGLIFLKHVSDILTRYERKYVDYAATLKCKYKYKNPFSMESYAKLWGLNPTPSRIWNGVPFSFLVDWVIDIEGFLSQFEEDLALSVVIEDYCDTITAYRQYEYWRRPYRNSSDCSEEYTEPLIMHYAKTYYRKPSTPSTDMAFPVLDTLSTRELVLGGALLRTLM